MNDGDPMAALRDIHAAPVPGWWPPAPGWWLLGALVLLLMVWGVVALRRRRRRQAPWRSLRRQLNRIYARHRETGDAADFVRGVSTLLRRAAMVVAPREQVAALHGQSWLEFLDRSGGTSEFREGSGRVLADGPYVPKVEPDVDALYELVRQWCRRAPRLRHRTGDR